MMYVLCNRELKQWLFVEETRNERETDAVFMSKNGDMVRHTTIEMDTKSYLDKLNQESWERLR